MIKQAGHYWHIIAHSKSIGQRPVKLVRFSKNLVLYRSNSGKVVCMSNYCLHRNIELSEGCVQNGIITCPYHGWQYDESGNVINIPATSNRPKNLKNNTYRVVDDGYYIWVNFSTDDTLGIPKDFYPIQEKGWEGFKFKSEIHSTVERCLENFLDCPHAAYVHKNIFRNQINQPTKATVSINDVGAEAIFINEPMEKSLIWGIFARKKNGKMIHKDKFIMPSISNAHYSYENGISYKVNSFCTPINQEKVIVFTNITYRVNQRFITKLIKYIFKPISLFIMNQDIKILEKQSSAIKTREGRYKFKIIEQDLLYRYIITWRKTLLSEGAEKPKPESKEVEIMF